MVALKYYVKPTTRYKYHLLLSESGFSGIEESMVQKLLNEV